MSCFCYKRKDDDLEYIYKLKICINNYFVYYLGEPCPHVLPHIYTLSSLRDFMKLYKIKEKDVLDFKNVL